MKFAREFYEQYQKAYALANRNLQRDKKLGLSRTPVVLEDILDKSMIANKIDLGITDIPTNLITGIAHQSQALTLYTRAFLPTSDPDSDYAEHWIGLYHEFVNQGSFCKEIKCVEYLGKFYVIDGLKRVSVARCMESCTISAHVIRIMPVKNDTTEILQYFDFLRQYQMTHLYQLQFTQKGYFNKLQEAMQKQNTCVWDETDRISFLKYWPKIEAAFEKSYGDYLKITAADALVVLMKRYTYSQIIHMDPWVLARVFQAAGKELYAISFPELCKSEAGGNGRLHTA